MLTAAVIVLGLIVVLTAVLVAGLLRSHAEILRALHEMGISLEEGHDPHNSEFKLNAAAPDRAMDDLPPGADLPLGVGWDIMGTTPSGDAIAVAITGVERQTLLAFLSGGCLTCRDFWEAFAAPSNRFVAGPDTQLVVVTRGPDAESPAEIAEISPDGLVTVMSSEAWDDYGVPVAPYFVLVDGSTSQVVGQGATASFDQLGSLMSKATADVTDSKRRSRRELVSGAKNAQAARERDGVRP